MVQKGRGSQTPGASVFIQLPHKSPESPGKAEISPHLAILGLGVIAVGPAPVPHSAILLLRCGLASPAPASAVAPSSPPRWATRSPVCAVRTLELSPAHRRTYQKGYLRPAGDRSRRMEEVGSAWRGRRERAHQVRRAAVLSRDAPCARPPSPASPPPTFLPQPHGTKAH